jgi:hypothetical protein
MEERHVAVEVASLGVSVCGFHQAIIAPTNVAARTARGRPSS